MNTEKIEKLKRGLNNSQIPESLKEKIRQQISRLEDEDKANQPVAKAEIEKIEDKIEEAVEVAEKKEEQGEAKKPTTARKPRAKKVVEPKAKTVRKPRAKKVVEPKTTTANKKSAMALAKEIRKPNEKWNEAVKRAGATMRGEVKEATKKVTSELEKLKAFVKKRKELKTIAGTNLLRDSKRKAKRIGKRVSKEGNVYYEYRDNRTDRLAPNYPKNAPLLVGGGALYSAYTDNPLKYLSLMGAKTHSDLNYSTNKNGIDYYIGIKKDKYDDNKAIVVAFITDENNYMIDKEDAKEMSETARQKGIDKVELYTNYGVELRSNQKPQTLGFDKIIKVSGNYADGGGVEGIEEDIDMTEDYVLKVNKGVQPENRASLREWMGKTNESREAMTYEIGGNLAGQLGGGVHTTPTMLDGTSGTHYTDLVGETGALSSAEMFEGGGAIKVGVFGIEDLKTGVFEKAFDKKSKETGLTNVDLKVVEKNGKKFVELYLITNEEAQKKFKVKKWYMKNYRTDTLGKNLDADFTFEDVWTALNNGTDVYSVFGVGDSLIRERIFTELAKIYNVDYDYIYLKWLDSDDYARGGGIRKVGNREYPLGRNWTNDHNQINKSEEHETSYNRKRSFAGGGGVDNVEHFPLDKIKLDEDAQWYADRIKSGKTTTTKKSIIDSIEEYKKDLFLLEIGRKKPSNIIGTGYRGNTRKMANTWLLEQIYIEEKILKLLENHSFADGGAVMANQQIIDNASQQYVNYYLGEGASTGMYKDGGAIKNQYAGRTPRDIWNNLTKAQRHHFLHDHEEEILENKKLRYFTNSDLVEFYNSDWFELDDDVKNAFGEHTSRGEYATGGMMHNHTEMEDSYARGGGIRTVNGREYSTGRNWTNDHRQHNKGEDYEVPMNKRR